MPVMDPSFYQKLLEVSNDVQMKPEDLLNVMAVESGIDPTAHNRNGNASGLLQFMPSTLKNMGFQGTHADFRNLSAVDRLDYVKKLIQSNMKFNGGPFTSAAQYYVANFLPVALQLPGIKEGNPNTVIVAKNPDKPHLPGVSTRMESIYYNANPVLDADGDGAITYGDIRTVLARAAGGKNFKSALAQLQNATGYQPSSATTMAANVPNINLYDIINQYLQQVSASDRSNKKLYKKFLPNHNILIRIFADDKNNAIEFSRILTAALDEELSASSFIHTNGHQIEIECKIAGPKDICFKTVKELTDAVAEAFEIATKKIGGIQIKTACVMNKKSSYQEIDLKTANLQYRKFLLKFI
jgi:Transglycosylase SLT domain